MQDLATYFEKGFFAAIGFIATGFLALFGFHAKSNKEFRANIHKKVDDLSVRVSDIHITKGEFQIAFDSLNKDIESIKTDVREIRERYNESV